MTRSDTGSHNMYDIKHHQILGRLKTKLYEKHDDFIFPIINSTFIRNNIPVVPAYVVGIIKLIHYSCDAMDISQLWTQKLLKQSYVTVRLKSSIQQFYGHNHELSNHYEMSISQMAMQLFSFPVDMRLSSISDQTFPGVRRRVFYKNGSPFASNWVHPICLWMGPCCSYFCFLCSVFALFIFDLFLVINGADVSGLFVLNVINVDCVSGLFVPDVINVVGVSGLFVLDCP